MNFKGVAQKFGKEFVGTMQKNSPTILGATAIVCMVGALASLWKAKNKVDEAISEKRRKNAEILKSEDKTEEEIESETKENTKKCVKDVVIALAPTCIFAGLSITCIVGAQRINNKRIAALSAAYTIAERNLDDFKKKAEEILGKSKVEKVDDEVNKDRCDDIVEKVNNGKIVVQNSGFGNEVFIEEDSGQVFISSTRQVYSAINDFNQDLLENAAAYYDPAAAESYVQTAEDIYRNWRIVVPEDEA